MIGWPMFTRATVPWGLPKAPLIPVWSLSAPAHDNILLILMTWNGCSLIRI
ncbi:GSCOCG00006910001-RA-CDS [Cotesia congregata]|nr:GSCOCG00006910001-RA-CDS [Cotesia congregata]